MKRVPKDGGIRVRYRPPLGSWLSGLALRYVATTMAMTAAIIIAVYAVAYSHSVSIASLIRDPAQSVGLDWYVGLLSWVGVLIWTASAAVALFASFHAEPASRRHLLRGVGLLAAFLVLDDVFMLHDVVLPMLLGNAAVELALYAAYAGTAVVLARRYWRALSPVGLAFGVTAILMLGSSVVVDVSGFAPVFVEDGLKLLGIVAWSGMCFSEAELAVSRSESPSDDQDHPDSLQEFPSV